MPVYTGIEGVVRENAGIDAAAINTAARHTQQKVCVDGVIRNLQDLGSTIDHIEIVASYVKVSHIDGNMSVLEEWESLEKANQVGNVTIGENYIKVTASTVMYGITLLANVYAVFKDGHKILININRDNITFAFNVSYVNSFSGAYGVSHYFGNQNFYDGGSSSGTRNIVGTTVSDPHMSIDNLGGGADTIMQTYNSCTVNGRAVPIVVINSL